MPEIRVTHAIDPELNHDCNLIHIESYELKEVILPATDRHKARKAIAIVIRGRNFRSVAEPLVAYVGKVPVRYLRITPDEQSIEGILLELPAERPFVDVVQGDDHARHPTPFDPAMIRRID